MVLSLDIQRKQIKSLMSYCLDRGTGPVPTASNAPQSYARFLDSSSCHSSSFSRFFQLLHQAGGFVPINEMSNLSSEKVFRHFLSTPESNKTIFVKLTCKLNQFSYFSLSFSGFQNVSVTDLRLR